VLDTARVNGVSGWNEGWYLSPRGRKNRGKEGLQRNRNRSMRSGRGGEGKSEVRPRGQVKEASEGGKERRGAKQYPVQGRRGQLK